MVYKIKELRDTTGLTQQAFAERYGIPLSTLRKWEQGEATPAPYVTALIARELPYTNRSLRVVHGPDDARFYCDEVGGVVYDEIGNSIRIRETLEGVKEQNLGLYLQDLFEGLYEIQGKFERDCRFDKEDDIIWTR